MSHPISANLLELERSIQTLSFEEKLWLLERIAHQLQAKAIAFEISDIEGKLAEMADDPEIQAELTAINAEFAITEMDGLN